MISGSFVIENEGVQSLIYRKYNLVFNYLTNNAQNFHAKK